MAHTARTTSARIAVFACVAILTGCASQVAGNGEAAKVIAAGVVAEGRPGATETSLVSDDEGACIGRAVVDDIGQDGLVDAGVLSKDHTAFMHSPQDASAKVAGAWIGAFSQCLDLRHYFVGLTRLTVDGTLDPARDDAWAGVQTCVDGDVPISDVETTLRALLQGRTATTSTAEAFNQCVGAVRPA